MNHHPQPGPNKFDLVGQKVLIHVVDANAAHIAHYGVTTPHGSSTCSKATTVGGITSTRGPAHSSATRRVNHPRAARERLRRRNRDHWDHVRGSRVVRSGLSRTRASSTTRCSGPATRSAPSVTSRAPRLRRFAAVGSRRDKPSLRLRPARPARTRARPLGTHHPQRRRVDRISSRSDAVVDKYNLTFWEIGLTVERDDPELLKRDDLTPKQIGKLAVVAAGLRAGSAGTRIHSAVEAIRLRERIPGRRYRRGCR